MPIFLRRAFPFFAIGLLIAALAWAVSFGTLPPADFTFDNSTEIETIDPAMSTGQPENRIINCLFEGLLRNSPEEGWETKYQQNENVPMTPQPGMAEIPHISDDGRVYTFHMRKDAQWSNGDPVTANDFAWSWRRTLHPETGSKYAYQLYYIVGAKQYNLSQVQPGDAVEVELADRPDPLQPFPRGTVVRGTLVSIHQPPQPEIAEGTSDDARSRTLGEWRKTWVYVVDEASGGGQPTEHLRLFAKDSSAARAAQNSLSPALPANLSLDKLERCLHVLPDFEKTVGVKAENPQTLVVTLTARTPFFTDLVAFYPLYPVNRKCVETYGTPNWTRPENIVTSGPFTLQFRRIRDRIRMVKNDRYWDQDRVKLGVVDALAIKGETTSLNMYLNGQIDWSTQLPVSTIPLLREKYADQFRYGPELTVNFYRCNVTRPELKDPRVRRALAMAIDRVAITERVTGAGEMPATSLCPPGMTGYTPPEGAKFDPAGAKQLLAEAGYPGGQGLPTIEILYNEVDVQRTIAETIQQMWKENLGISTELRGLEWGVYLDTTHKLDFAVARAGWIADYSDPNTFLDMFVTDRENNQTGWSNARYDELIRLAAVEPDPVKRMDHLHEAETILLDEQPIIPIYFRVSKNLVNPRVKGFFNNVQDEHPLKWIEVADK